MIILGIKAILGYTLTLRPDVSLGLSRVRNGPKKGRILELFAEQFHAEYFRCCDNDDANHDI